MDIRTIELIIAKSYTISELKIIKVLLENDALTAKEIGEKLSLKNTNVFNILVRLKNRELLNIEGQRDSKYSIKREKLI